MHADRVIHRLQTSNVCKPGTVFEHLINIVASRCYNERANTGLVESRNVVGHGLSAAREHHSLAVDHRRLADTGPGSEQSRFQPRAFAPRSIHPCMDIRQCRRKQCR